MADRNLQRAKPDSLAKHTSLKSYYETLTRVHERLTELPDDESSDAEQCIYEPWFASYGGCKLEWNHGYYGAARFTDTAAWYMVSGWEVGKYPGSDVKSESH